MRMSIQGAVLVVFFSWWIGIPPAADASIVGLSFSQTDFAQGAHSVVNSDWGYVSLDYQGAADLQYFNLVVNGIWEIQNAPLISSEGIGIQHSLGLNFDLGISSQGENITKLHYVAALGMDLLSTLPGGDPTVALVSDKTVTVGGRGIGGYEPAVSPGTTSIINLPVKVGYNSGMTNQDCGVDECVPTSFSNSLRWLDTKNDRITIPEEKKSIESLKGPTHWSAPSVGADGKKIPGTGGTPLDGSDWMGKRDALKDYVTTRKFEMNQIDAVIDEIKRGQDVELMGKYHGATVTGIVKHADGTYTIRVAHDTLQGEAGGTTSQNLHYDAAHDKLLNSAYGFNRGQGLDWFVVECPIPEPHSIAIWLFLVVAAMGLRRAGPRK